MANPKVAVVLAGCGVFDGAEIQEAVLTMLAIARQGGTYQCFAPNSPQNHVINHLTGQEEHGATRNVLIEAARIARGNVKDLREFKAADYDAILFPGGFGVAKNLCTFALDGPECHVNSDAERVIREVHEAGKPIGALCIAPALIARVLKGVTVTIGDNREVSDGLESMGATHITAGHGDVVIDHDARLATTPCYMLDGTIDQIATGADAVVAAVFDMIKAAAD